MIWPRWNCSTLRVLANPHEHHDLNAAMTDIRTQWSEVVRRLRSAESLLILSDFEGTLVDHDAEGGAPLLTTFSRGLLQSLTTLSGLTLAIHGTGSVGNLVSRAGIKRIWYVANGGLDIRDPEEGETHFYGPDDIRIMGALHEQLVSQTRRLEGIRIEMGGPTLTLYYRHVDPANVQIVLEAFRSVAQSAGPIVMTLHRPGIIEARIRSACDERSAVRYIRRYLKPGVLIVYLGQNARVQDSLRDLHPSAIVVDSGESTLSLPEYSIPGASAILEVLTRLAEDWSKSRTGGTIPRRPLDT
jgi:trehalose-6-phosphatase